MDEEDVRVSLARWMRSGDTLDSIRSGRLAACTKIGFRVFERLHQIKLDKVPRGYR